MTTAIHLTNNIAPKIENEPLELIFDRNGIVNCTLTKLPCVTDRQCTDNCSLQNAVGTMVCDNGFCANADLRVAGRPDDFECDQSLGLIKVYVASEFVVDQLCISTYRDIVDDVGRPRPYLCDAGTLDVDVVRKQFSPADCTCAENFTKMLFNQGAYTRAIPVCIPNSIARVYSKIYDIIK